MSPSDPRGLRNHRRHQRRADDPRHGVGSLDPVTGRWVPPVKRPACHDKHERLHLSHRSQLRNQRRRLRPRKDPRQETDDPTTSRRVAPEGSRRPPSLDVRQGWVILDPV
ncbi:hypothetical protein BHE74_00014807 [Ensete ventricosum]|nr:hypothetical protein BHE74_00014807 [Ensete ventricosum]